MIARLPQNLQRSCRVAIERVVFVVVDAELRCHPIRMELFEVRLEDVKRTRLFVATPVICWTLERLQLT